MEKETLEILYQDDVLVIVNKPSGLLVHRSPIDKHETRFALQIVREQVGTYVYPVHRLDKPTSGVLVFALDKQTAQTLSLAFREGEVHKEYIAIVRGYTDEEKTINHPLKQMLDTKEQKKQGITKEEQEAITHYKRLATVELPHEVGRYKTARYSLVKLTPKTGRKHQLRRHMKHDMHHIIGDTNHGRGEHNKLFRSEFGVNRLLLHARRIGFLHPVSGEHVEVEAGVDVVFERLFDVFGWGGDI